MRALRSRADELRDLGWSEEAIARDLVSARNALKQAVRAEDDPGIVALLEARNRAKYGDPVGPNAEWLRARYGSWAEVIDAACRPARLSRDG